jgi:hypothetical protein
MTDKKINRVARKYRKRGIIMPTSLLLKPDDALDLLTELSGLEVLVTGCECWRYIDKERREVVEEPGGGFSVEYYIPYNEMTAEPSIELLKQFIKEQRQPTCELVSFSFDDPKIWDLFTGEEEPS